MRVQSTMKVHGRVSTVVLLALATAKSAHADEPIKVGEPRVLSEPGEITDVVDAFDGDDLFDLHLDARLPVLVRRAPTSAVRRRSAMPPIPGYLPEGSSLRI